MREEEPGGEKNTSPTAAILGYLAAVVVTGLIVVPIGLATSDMKGSKGAAEIVAIIIIGLYFGIAQLLTEYFKKRFFKKK
jgi:hypothetical protein